MGFYDTLEDIGKCKKLQVLDMNSRSREGEPSYQVTGDEVGKIKTSEEVEQLQQELKKILPELKKLKEFSFTNAGKNCEITDINFLEGCRKLETVWIYHSAVKDYFVLEKCRHLKKVYLAKSKIETADVLLRLKELEEIDLRETPLFLNEKELKKLYEKFPDVKIFI